MSAIPPAPFAISCLAVDQEPADLERLCSFVERTPFLQLAGCYGQAAAAWRAVRQQPEVKLVFLDAETTGVDGLELARALLDTGPRVILSSASHDQAVEAFKVNALDYLLKPFSYEEFLRAAFKARAWLAPRPRHHFRRCCGLPRSTST